MREPAVGAFCVSAALSNNLSRAFLDVGSRFASQFRTEGSLNGATACELMDGIDSSVGHPLQQVPVPLLGGSGLGRRHRK